ncbi:hypothetical protein DFJ74DRAFT_609024 [Hyaloraphidium curvatum]|nr:hypothetical protein DFJ74DRAFT_609024 [Hyaloraphidium curvatum]
MAFSPEPEYTSDDPRPVRIVFVGGGMAGINFGIMAQWRLKNATFRIYEMNSLFGGVWVHNRYPGVRCDVPSYSYTFRFENNDWSEGYAKGPEIMRYFDFVAKKYNVLANTTLEAEVRELEWLEDKKKWRIAVDTRGGRLADEADFVILGTGFLNRAKKPAIPGFDLFPNSVHTAQWPQDLVVKPTDRVGVIGTGSSGMQVVGALSPVVKDGHMTVFMRTPYSVAKPLLTICPASYILPETSPMKLTPEMKKVLNDPKGFYRYALEGYVAGEKAFTGYFPGSRVQKVLQAKAIEHMHKNIKDKALLESLMPSYSIGCRRYTLTTPFLEAIQMPWVTVNREPIVRIDEAGVITRGADGAEKQTKLDLLVTATGFDVTYKNPRMKITGRGGKDLWERFKPHPTAYRSVTVDGFPNFFYTMGPYPPKTQNSIFASTQQQINYAFQMIVRWQCDSTILSYEVKREEVDRFDREAQEFLKGSVWIEPCGGYYQDRESNYLIMWPGSGLHHHRAIYAPEYEHYIVERAPQGKL